MVIGPKGNGPTVINSPKDHLSEWSIVLKVIGPNDQQSEGSLFRMVYSSKGH